MMTPLHNSPPDTTGYKSELQTDPQGVLHHLLTLDGLSRATMVRLMDRAQQFIDGEEAPDALNGFRVSVNRQNRKSCVSPPTKRISGRS